MKNTLVLGAIPNPERYGFKAVQRLIERGHPVYAYGIRKGMIGTIEIKQDWPSELFDTVTLYLNPELQKEYYQAILNLKPKRVIFNPGTENTEFQDMLTSAGIEVEVACTLVLLSLNSY